MGIILLIVVIIGIIVIVSEIYTDFALANKIGNVMLAMFAIVIFVSFIPSPYKAIYARYKQYRDTLPGKNAEIIYCSTTTPFNYGYFVTKEKEYRDDLKKSVKVNDNIGIAYLEKESKIFLPESGSTVLIIDKHKSYRRIRITSFAQNFYWLDCYGKDGWIHYKYLTPKKP